MSFERSLDCPDSELGCRRASARCKKNRATGRLGKCLAIRVSPALPKRLDPRRIHDRPHTPAEAGSERGSRDSAKLTSLTYQRNRFRYLVPQTALCTPLRPRHKLAKLHQIPTRQRVTSRRNDLTRLGVELIESLSQRFCRVVSVRRCKQYIADQLVRVGGR